MLRNKEERRKNKFHPAGLDAGTPLNKTLSSLFCAVYVL
jgi:hypothetical protein